MISEADGDRRDGAPEALAAAVTPGDLVAVMTGFARTLRAAGVPADHDRTQNFLRALSHLDAARPGDAYWAGRFTLCASADDLPRYDRVFRAYFGGLRAGRAKPAAVTVVRHTAALAGDRGRAATARSPRRPRARRRCCATGTWPG
ncbi:hypothetical protein ACFQX6_23695 [Streptosporangium lutulentum]